MLLYLQMKPECKHCTEESEIDSKPHNECRDEVENQISSNRKLDVIYIVGDVAAEQTVDGRDWNHDNKTIDVFKKPPPAFDIQPLIDEVKRKSCIEPIEILQSLQRKLHIVRDFNLLSLEGTSPHCETNYVSMDGSRVLESTVAEL